MPGVGGTGIPSHVSKRGELRHNPGHLIDIVPTLLEVTGAPRFETWEGMPVPPTPGKSLVPAFTKDGSVPHDFLWWQHEGNRALRVDDWKIVAAGADALWELYDLKTDRVESIDLAAAQPERVQELGRVWTENFEAFCDLAKK